MRHETVEARPATGFFIIWSIGASIILLLGAGCRAPTFEEQVDDPSPTGDPTPPPSGDDDISPTDVIETPVAPTWPPASPSGDDDVIETPETSPGDDDDETVDVTPSTGDDDATPGWPTMPVGDDDATPWTTQFPGDDDETDPNGDPPKPPGVWRTGLFLVTDTATACVSVFRPSDASTVWSHSALDPTAPSCEPTFDAGVHEAHHVVHNDVDYVDYIMSIGEELTGLLRRVPMANPSVPTFEIRGFDFSFLHNSLCTLPPEKTCGGARNLPAACTTWFPHSFGVVDDDPAEMSYTAIIADHGDSVMEVTLDYGGGSSCARVNWILDATNPDWEPSCNPNHIQILDDNGTQYLVVTCRNLYRSLAYGQIQLFRRAGQGVSTNWSRVWTFPDPAIDAQEPYLNSPHQGRILSSESGGYELIYAHSNGLASTWNDSAAGSIGTAILPTIETPPDYVAEETFTKPAQLAYVKSIDYMPDGYRILTDFGSYPPAPPAPAAIFIVTPKAALENSDLAGYWLADHNQQSVYDISEGVQARWECGWGGLYQALWIDPGDYGSLLRSLPTAGGAKCPAPLPSAPLYQAWRH